MWKRRKLTAKDNSEKISFNSHTGLHHAVLREPSVVDEFYFEEIDSPDGNKVTIVCDPIVMLLNQNRIANMGVTAAKTFLDSLQPRSSALSEMRKNCSDEMLMEMMKSRHLQSPAEILAWCRHIEQNMTEFNDEVSKMVAEAEAKKAEEAAQTAKAANAAETENFNKSE